MVDDEVAPPRVLLLAADLASTGATRITLELARRWAGDGAVLAVLTRRAGTPELAPPPEVALVRLSDSAARLRTVLPRALVRLVAAARRCDVVLACSEITLAPVLGLVAARLTGRRFVIAVHADLDAALAEWTAPRLRPVIRRAHRRADGVVAVAPALVAPLVANGLPPQRARVVVNGIDLAAVRAAGAGPGSVLLPGPPCVVATGRLAPQKAHELLVEAHARVVADTPHRLLLLNDGPERARLEALAAALGVSGSVVFAGAVPHVLASVARADAFCLPSRHEGLPLALHEAVALGVPCIAAESSPGVRAALDDGRVGDLVPVGDVDALAGALRRHLRDPAPLRERAARGPAHAAAYDVAAMAAGWAAALRELAPAAGAQAPK